MLIYYLGQITINILPAKVSGGKSHLRKSLSHNANTRLFTKYCIIQSCNKPLIIGTNGLSHYESHSTQSILTRADTLPARPLCLVNKIHIDFLGSNIPTLRTSTRILCLANHVSTQTFLLIHGSTTSHVCLN